MTRREGKKASEKSGIGEDERQPVMAQLAARWRRSNLAALEKGNRSGEERLAVVARRVPSKILVST